MNLYFVVAIGFYPDGSYKHNLELKCFQNDAEKEKYAREYHEWLISSVPKDTFKHLSMSICQLGEKDMQIVRTWSDEKATITPKINTNTVSFEDWKNKKFGNADKC